jgi:hypothetical protein
MMTYTHDGQQTIVLQVGGPARLVALRLAGARDIDEVFAASPSFFDETPTAQLRGGREPLIHEPPIQASLAVIPCVGYLRSHGH